MGNICFSQRAMASPNENILVNGNFSRNETFVLNVFFSSPWLCANQTLPCKSVFTYATVRADGWTDCSTPRQNQNKNRPSSRINFGRRYRHQHQGSFSVGGRIGHRLLTVQLMFCEHEREQSWIQYWSTVVHGRNAKAKADNDEDAKKWKY